MVNFFFKVAVTTFAIYIFTENQLTASKAFVALSLFNVMRFPMVMFPGVVVTCIQVSRSCFCSFSVVIMKLSKNSTDSKVAFV